MFSSSTIRWTFRKQVAFEATFGLCHLLAKVHTTMETWTPERIFIIAYIASSLSGLAALLWSGKPLCTDQGWLGVGQALRKILASMIYFGAAGTALGMVGFEWLGGREKPWRVIGCAMGVGLGAIDRETYKAFFKNILTVFSSNGKNGNGEDHGK